VDNPFPNPVIMLRETFSEELESILHFIYNGQVQVAEESLDDFLNTAKFLQVRLFFPDLRTFSSYLHIQVHVHVVKNMTVLSLLVCNFIGLALYTYQVFAITNFV